ncbi:hypothetical protein GCM10009741_34460 [Kribbella lupini]|uniref:Secreted protein n=1 Tax=Kribbella lupini TaxID=291602 RepID=A0ABN2AZI4_9ACTN
MSVLVVGTLAAAPVAAQAAPAGVTQPYGHLVSGTTWSTGGTYVAKGGKIELTLKTLPKATDVLVEECEGGGDLGDVQTFTKNASRHVLATGVAKGTCFFVLLQPHAGAGDYRVGGTLKY